MTPLAVALDGRQWELVALRLLIGVSNAASALPPQSLTEIVELLGGVERKGGRGRGR